MKKWLFLTLFILAGYYFNIFQYAYSQTTPVSPLVLSQQLTGGTAGVSCSGTPTMSFATINGIVTHC